MNRRAFVTLSGATAAISAGPFSALAALPPGIPEIGVLWHAGSREQEGANYLALAQGFAKLGYIDGQTVRLLHRFPDEQPEKFRSMAAELVAAHVDVLVSVGANAAPYAKAATSSIPVVFTLVSDPEGTGLVKSLARPEGNVTGFSNSARDLIGKRLEILKEMVPEFRRVALMVNGAATTAPLYVETITRAAATLGLSAAVFRWHEPAELVSTFESIKAAGMQAVLIAPDGLAFTHRAAIAHLAIERRLALSAWSRDILVSGALVTYGANQEDLCRRVAVYVDRLLKGAKPGDLPVEQPTTFELRLNQRTAKAIGLALPPTILARTDEVIE